MGAAKGLGIVDAGVADDHRDTIGALKEQEQNEIYIENYEVLFATKRGIAPMSITHILIIMEMILI